MIDTLEHLSSLSHGGLGEEVGMTAWRVRTVVVATVCALAVVGRAEATASFAFTRLAGSDRYDTARVVAERFGTSASVLMATGERFPDALAASYVAGVRNVPILLTAANDVPGATETALSRLKATAVTLVGGTNAISADVEDELRSRGYAVDRIAGASRYETADRLAQAGGIVGTQGGLATAVLASGENFPDAVAAAPVSYAGRFPILLTIRDRLSSEARTALTRHGIKQVLIPGGFAAVAAAVESEVRSMGIAVTRFGGDDRTDTAARLAEYAVTNLGFSRTHVNLARGDQFPDALAGGPHGGQDKAATLLAASPTVLGGPPASWLQSHADTLNDGHIFGGTAAISSAVEDAAEAAAGASFTAPRLEVTGGPADGTATTDSTPSYSGTAADNSAVVRVEVKVDGGSFTTTGITCVCGGPNATWLFNQPNDLPEGTHTFSFRAVDDVGLPSAEVARRLLIDATAPTFQSIRIRRNTAVVSADFSEPMLCSTVAASDFVTRINETTPAGPTAVTCSGTVDPTISLTLSSNAPPGSTVSVTLTGAVTDEAGNEAPRPTTRDAKASGGKPA